MTLFPYRQRRFSDLIKLQHDDGQSTTTTAGSCLQSPTQPHLGGSCLVPACGSEQSPLAWTCTRVNTRERTHICHFAAMKGKLWSWQQRRFSPY